MLLAIDTALKHCSVAIIKGDEVVFEKSVFANNTQAELLPLMVQEAFKEAKIKGEDLSKIAVSSGPGSFNGVRVGLAFAKGLSLALEKEIIGISSLEAYCKASNEQKIIAAINIAGSVFAAAIENDKWVMPPTRFDDFEFLNNFDDSYALIGYNLSTEAKESFKYIESESIDPIIIAKLAQNRNEIDYPPNPIYLRGADAKLWEGGKFA